MPGFVTKESWSRCEQSSTLYDTIRNPHARYVPPKSSIITTSEMDTIESTQKRLNREMIKRLRSLGVQLPHDAVVAVVKVGKSMLLAVMLPPYLLLYGIPRWMLLTLFPELLNVGKEAALAVGRYFFQVTKHIRDLTKGLIDQLLGNMLRASKDKGKNLWRHLTDIIRGAEEKIKDVAANIANIKEGITTSLRNFHVTLKGKINQVFHPMRDWVLAKLETATSAIKSKAIAWGTAFDKNILTPTVEAIAMPFIWLHAKGTALNKAVQQHIAKVRNAVKKRAEAIVEESVKSAYKSVVEKSRQAIKTLMDPIVTWALERKEAVELTWKKTRDKLKEGIEAAISAAAKTKEHLVEGMSMALHGIQVLPLAIIQIGRAVWRFQPRDKRKDPRGNVFKRFWQGSKRFIKGTIKATQQISVEIKCIILKMSKMLQTFYMLLLRFAERLATLLLIVLMKIYSVVKMTTLVIVRTIQKTSYLLRLLIAFIWASCCVSWHIVQQTLASLHKIKHSFPLRYTEKDFRK